MFRLLRKPASMFAARGQAAKMSRFGPPSPRTQAVRIHRRRISFRRIALGAAAYYVCYRIYTNVVFTPIINAAEKELESLSEKEREELEKQAAEDVLFIPFPFTTTQVESRPYRGDDPEWQAFMKISRDKELQNRIRMDMVNVVKMAAEKHPFIKARAGPGAIRVRRYWLDIDFPYKPAPTFEQSGIRIDDDGIFWATEPVDSITVNRVRKLLWPEAMAKSTYVFSKALVYQHFVDLKTALGFSTADGSFSRSPTSSQPVDLRSGKASGPLSPPPPPQAQRPDGTTEARSGGAPPGESSPSGGGTARFPPRDGSKENSSEGVSLPEAVQRWIKHPLSQGHKTFAQSWKTTMGYPPRGCIMLSGLVELETPKVYFVVDVASWWNPATKKFDTDSMVLNLRRYEAKVQRPIG